MGTDEKKWEQGACLDHWGGVNAERGEVVTGAQS